MCEIKSFFILSSFFVCLLRCLNFLCLCFCQCIYSCHERVYAHTPIVKIYWYRSALFFFRHSMYMYTLSACKSILWKIFHVRKFRTHSLVFASTFIALYGFENSIVLRFRNRAYFGKARDGRKNERDERRQIMRLEIIWNGNNNNNDSSSTNSKHVVQIHIHTILFRSKSIYLMRL